MKIITAATPQEVTVNLSTIPSIESTVDVLYKSNCTQIRINNIPELHGLNARDRIKYLHNTLYGYVRPIILFILTAIILNFTYAAKGSMLIYYTIGLAILTLFIKLYINHAHSNILYLQLSDLDTLLYGYTILFLTHDSVYFMFIVATVSYVMGVEKSELEFIKLVGNIVYIIYLFCTLIFCLYIAYLQVVRLIEYTTNPSVLQFNFVGNDLLIQRAKIRKV